MPAKVTPDFFSQKIDSVDEFSNARRREQTRMWLYICFLLTAVVVQYWLVINRTWPTLSLSPPHNAMPARSYDLSFSRNINIR